MSINQKDLIRRFVKGSTSGNSSNMFIECDKIFSYGHHFILAIRLNDGKYLVNGDTYSSSTSKQQSYIRDLCKPNFIIPFSALERITGNLNTEKANNIKIIEQTRDKYREIPYIDPKTKEQKIRTEHELGGVLFSYENNYYLSSTDINAKNFRGGYFLVEIPEKANTVKEALDLLIPIELRGTNNYLRQGEFFFVPTEIKEKDLVDSQTGRYAINTYFDQTKVSRNNHDANKLKLDKDGNVFVKGRILHPEHKSLSLGQKTWYRVYINRAKQSIAATGNID